MRFNKRIITTDYWNSIETVHKVHGKCLTASLKRVQENQIIHMTLLKIINQTSPNQNRFSIQIHYTKAYCTVL